MTDKITLPDRNSDAGVEARVLLAECPSPAATSYTLEAASEAMQLMDAVLRNRLQNPGPFRAKGAKSLVGLVKAPGQFKGFEKYPDYSGGIKQNIQDALDIANNSKDARSAQYAQFVRKAIEIAKSTKYSDPSPGKLVAWRTANSGSPGKGFLLYKTLLGNDFYYQ
jgi:hypothetical protein